MAFLWTGRHAYTEVGIVKTAWMQFLSAALEYQNSRI
jgi:hypothetical protein